MFHHLLHWYWLNRRVGVDGGRMWREFDIIRVNVRETLVVNWIFGCMNRWAEQGKATHKQKTLTVPSPKPLGNAQLLFLLKELRDRVKRNMVPSKFYKARHIPIEYCKSHTCIIYQPNACEDNEVSQHVLSYHKRSLQQEFVNTHVSIFS